jgi:glycosyltransferase involved in cell wall biosynthesis
MDKRISVGYTIFNKKNLIPEIIEGFKDILDENDEFIIVFDGCTDNSYEIFCYLKHFLKCRVNIQIFKEDEFEIKANNWILENALYDTVVLFQDDILNKDKNIREKIFEVYKKFGKKTGLIGGRSGYELDGFSDFPEKSINKVSNWEHLPKQYGIRLKEGESYPRTFLNRGPIVFSRNLINEVGLLEESYYPLWGDDLDYCARAKFIYGRTNVVFQCDVISKLKWGTTHIKGASKIPKDTFKVNWYRFIESWGRRIQEYNRHENPIIV